MKKTIYLDPDIETLIVSAGGVGTTFLIKAIGAYKKTNDPDNLDGYKHLPIPPISKNQSLKVIYIFGDPLVATVSLFRRKYHRTQSAVMQKFRKEKVLLPLDLSLQEYVAQGKDRLFFGPHFNHWVLRFPFYDTLFIHYDVLFDHLKEIRDFLDLPASFIENFPPKKDRASSLDQLDATTLEGLENMYGYLVEQFQQLPSFFINETERTASTRLFFSQPLYRTAIWEAFLRDKEVLRKGLQRLGMGG